jgi:hypothetical protein
LAIQELDGFVWFSMVTISLIGWLILYGIQMVGYQMLDSRKKLITTLV